MDEGVLREVLLEELSRINRILLIPDSDSLNSASVRLECLYGHILRIHEQNVSSNIVNEEVVDTIRKLLSIVNSISEDDGFTCDSTWQLPDVIDGHRGRPKYDLPRDQLQYLIENGFTTSRICSMLCISLSTLRRRMSEYGIRVRDTYSDISDTALKDLVMEAHLSFPNAGYRFVRGWLHQRGLRIQESRIRQLMREVDPIGTNRFFRSIHRREYSVSGPQALWHLDGNHKLIRWRFVIHGAIDGFSRVVVFMNCSANNYAQTVLTLFVKAVSQFGLPARIRCDQGVENYDAAMFMLTHPLRASSINPEWVNAWNDHRMTSCHNMSPMQMWIHGYFRLRGTSCTLAQEMFNEPVEHNYGIDWFGPLPTEVEENETNAITIPLISCPLSVASYQDLLQSFPNDHSSIMQDNSYGIDTYINVRNFVSRATI
uniref:Integrase catalytic domain-containing protein n=1 Tax=Amphimedon queenslandica TaxID=400682 RepID=A0A1X7USS9_AMPQE